MGWIGSTARHLWGILLRGGLLAMAISCISTISLAYAGDRRQTYPFAGANNPNSPDQERFYNLSSGDNTIDVPISGVTAQGAVILPPPSNTLVVLKIKGNAGDTGVAINRANPTQLGLDSGVASFILNASAAIIGVRVRIF